MTEFTTTEAARRLGVTQPAINSAIKKGRLPAHRVLLKTRPVWRIKEADLLALKLFRQGRPPGTEPPNPSGICQCGCGQKLTPVRHSDAYHDIYKGECHRFARGHKPTLSLHQYLVDEETGCWVWQRGIGQGTGYGMLRGKSAHVIFWESRHGPVPVGLELDHLCRNRRCVNPNHLEAVTHTINVRRGKVPKINMETAERIRFLRSTEHLTYARLAQMFSVSPNLIAKIVRREIWVL